MIHPSSLTPDIAPPVLAQKGLLQRTKHWGFARGALSPFIQVDPLARFQAGYRGLMAHEALHCVERHVFWTVFVGVGTGLIALVLVLAGFVAGGGAMGTCLWGALGAILGGLGYLTWWQREREIRADAFALEDVGLSAFYAFLLMVGHPAVADGPAHGPLGFARRFWLRTYRRWLRWVYGRTLQARVERAARRRSRLKWPPSPAPRSPVGSSRSASSAEVAAPRSR